MSPSENSDEAPEPYSEPAPPLPSNTEIIAEPPSPPSSTVQFIRSEQFPSDLCSRRSVPDQSSPPPD
ncbi:MAG: hypothetical protein OXI96_01700 [Acidimicrobiaceae bacterium]|nr:hypothetical protein [Acidimicrobiaceae bacterium]